MQSVCVMHDYGGDSLNERCLSYILLCVSALQQSCHFQISLFKAELIGDR